MNLAEPLNPRARDQRPSLPLRKQSLDSDRALLDDKDSVGFNAPSLKPISQCVHGKTDPDDAGKLIQSLKDAAKISNDCEHHFEPLSPVSKANFGRPRDSATRRSGAPHKGTRKADFLASLSKPSKTRPKGNIQSRASSGSRQRASKSSSVNRRFSSSSMKSNSDNEVRRWSHGNLPTITEFHKCSFREDKSSSERRKVSSCDDMKQRRRSSRTKQANKPCHRNASFDSMISQKSTSLLSPKTRKSIQNTVLDPSLFQYADLESCSPPSSKSEHGRMISWSDNDSPSTSKSAHGRTVSFAPLTEKGPSPRSAHGKPSCPVIAPSLLRASSGGNYVDEDEAFPTQPSSTRGVFDGAMEQADMPRLPIRKKSERSIGL